MGDQKEHQTFQYTYSAKQQEEVARIRKKYLPQEADKMEQLRRLDRSATKKGTVVSVVVGTLGTLVMGLGMCCTLEWGGALFVPGVVIGLIGIAAVAAAYPLYTAITKRQRKKLAPQILKLTEELSHPE